MKKMPPVITIDGPVASGKGTISKLMAQKLRFHLLDSGALYRVLALVLKQQQVDLEDEPAVAKLAANLDVQFEVTDENEPAKILLERKDVTDLARAEETGKIASLIAVQPAIRQALLNCQRAFRKDPGLIADGRDMGTVVFPNAEAKIFLTANRKERAKRRHKQLLKKGIDVKLAALVNELAERDARDEQRAVSPLKPARDAITVDTSGLTIDEVLIKVFEAVLRARLRAGCNA